jgi:hypothetical protein
MISLPNTGTPADLEPHREHLCHRCGTARSARRAASRIKRRSPWCSSRSMRLRKAGAGSMATTKLPSSFKVSGSPMGSKSPPTPRPRNPKPPPPDPSRHHQDSAIAHGASVLGNRVFTEREWFRLFVVILDPNLSRTRLRDGPLNAARIAEEQIWRPTAEERRNWRTIRRSRPRCANGLRQAWANRNSTTRAAIALRR